MLDLPILTSILDSTHHAAVANHHAPTMVHSSGQQTLWEWQGDRAGVYDNALGDLDTTPHVWTHATPVDPTTIDDWIPYGPVNNGVATVESAGMGSHHALVAANLKAAGDSSSLAGYDGTCNSMPGWNPGAAWNPQSGGGCTLNPMYDQPGLGDGASFGSGKPSLAAYDGTCNSMPGWNPGATWNPQSGGGCTLNPMYNQPGLGDGASFGSGKPALAIPPAIAENEIEASKEAKVLRPTCGHYLLATEACMFGALSATQNLIARIASGKADGALEEWRSSFEKASIDAAGSCTPMGAFVLENHVFGAKQEAVEA